MTTMNGSARPATGVAGVLDPIAGEDEGGHVAPRPNPEVLAGRAKRRRFTAEYKRSILDRADSEKPAGNLGAMLRREGLYSSLLVTWRREREAGILKGLTPRKRGPKGKADPLTAEYQKLQRENERLAEQLRKAEIAIDVQKKSGYSAGAGVPRNGDVVMAGLGELIPVVGVREACAALHVPRSSFYRKGVSGDSSASVASTKHPPARSLDQAERRTVLACLHEERFQNSSPAAVYATLLDEGRYHCSIRTMCRILADEGETRERRGQLVHPAYTRPELLATGPNQLWSWDITKLLGPDQMDLLLSLRDPGRIQPLRGGLDGGGWGKRRTGQTADCGYL